MESDLIISYNKNYCKNDTEFSKQLFCKTKLLQGIISMLQRIQLKKIVPLNNVFFNLS